MDMGHSILDANEKSFKNLMLKMGEQFLSFKRNDFSIGNARLFTEKTTDFFFASPPKNILELVRP